MANRRPIVNDAGSFRELPSGDVLISSVIVGGTGSGGNLLLRSTAHATKGFVAVERDLRVHETGDPDSASGFFATASGVASGYGAGGDLLWTFTTAGLLFTRRGAEFGWNPDLGGTGAVITAWNNTTTPTQQSDRAKMYVQDVAPGDARWYFQGETGSAVVVGNGEVQGEWGVFTTSVATPSLNNGGTLTLPTSTDTLVGRATADTLTNKTIVAANNAIITAASGNLTATNLNAALAELQGDIDTLSRLACQGRLTLESGVPVSTSDQTGKSTLYFTPHGGNLIGLYDGTRWTLHAFTERSLALSGLTSGANYDVFIYNNGGTLTLELSAAWTNATTRADALATKDGVIVKSGAATRRWLGTIRTTETTTTEDSEAKRFVWNKYNQVPRRAYFIDVTSHTQTTGTTRQWRAQAANQIDFVIGEAQSIPLTLVARAAGGAGPIYYIASFGIDSTTVESSAIYVPITAEHTNHGNRIQSFAAGRHFVSLNQRTEVATGTWYQGELGAYILG